ncbi:MAG: GrxA family glutaredoxin [Porticoccaceae bacterium]|nr:GrxA family glutaredoxin [Porticoccaceae bacterium]
MEPFTVFGRPGCGYCVRAKQVLGMKNLPHKYVDMMEEGISPADLEKTIGKPVRTVPQIFHGTQHIGGYTELEQYLRDMDS